MADMNELAQQTFTQCQGTLMFQGTKVMPNANDTAKMLSDISTELFILRKGLFQLSVGLTQLAAGQVNRNP